MMVFILLFVPHLSSANKSYPLVHVDTLIDFTREDSLALHLELNYLQAILRNDQFWKSIKSRQFYCENQRIYHASRKRRALYPRLKKDRHHYSSQEIHDLLWFGEDEIGGPKDGVINLKLQAKDYEPNKDGSVTHGSTNKNTLIIKSSRKTRIHSRQKGKYVCHILHEYMHVLGFKHKDNRPSKNKKKCGGVDVALGIQLIAEKVFFLTMK